MIKKKPVDFDYELAYWRQYVGREVVVVRKTYPASFQKGVGMREEIYKGFIASVFRELGKSSNAVIIWFTDHKSFMSSFYPQTTQDEIHFEIT